jgi:hypothetical protein
MIQVTRAGAWIMANHAGRFGFYRPNDFLNPNFWKTPPSPPSKRM